MNLFQIAELALSQPYERELFVLKFYGQLTGEWSNCYEHCLVVGFVCNQFGKMAELSRSEVITLTKAGLLHDWNKKKEVERFKLIGADAHLNALVQSKAGLTMLGYGKDVVDLCGVCTPNCLDTILSPDTSLSAKILHWVDDATLGSEFVSPEYRSDMTRLRYPELDQRSKEIYNGRSLFDKQKEIASRLEHQLRNLLNLSTKTRLREYLIRYIESKNVYERANIQSNQSW